MNFKCLGIVAFVAIALFLGKTASAQIESEKNWLLTGNVSGNNHFIGTTNNMPFVVKTNNITRMTIGSNGNVGIGTTDLSEKLVVNGCLKLKATTPGNSMNGTILFDGNEFLLRKNDQWLSLIYKSPWDTNNISVYTNRSVGIGVNDAKESLEISGALRLHNYSKNKNKEVMEDGTVFYDGTDILAMVDGEIDTLTDGGTPPAQEEFLWRKNAPRTNYTFFNVGIGTNTADKPLQILGKVDSVPTVRLTHRYITRTTGEEMPLDPLQTKEINKAPGDTITKSVDIWSNNAGLFFSIQGNAPDFGFTHTTMQSAVRFICNQGILTRTNLIVYNSMSVGKVTGFENTIPAKLYVEGNSLMAGDVAIGTATTSANLNISGIVSVGENVKIYPDGKMWVKNNIKVNVTKPGGWGDFVFEPNYNLKSLGEVEKYIKEHKHLEGIPSAKEIDAEGIDLGEMTTVLTQKVEELTLYVIEMNKTIELLKKENEELRKANSN